MARTDAGRALTEAHRVAQVQLAQRAVADFAVAFRALDLSNIDGTSPAYQRLAAGVINSYRDQSAKLSAAYLQAFRAAEGVGTAVDIALPAAIDPERLYQSLQVTGPVRAKQAIKRARALDVPMTEAVAQARASALASSSRAAMRHVLSGGRETIVATANREGRRVARVCDGSPCAFCAMMASRGAVYHDLRTAGFEAHDGCGCTVEIAYGDDYKLPPGSERYERLWTEHAEGTGRDRLNAFRRAYERPDIDRGGK